MRVAYLFCCINSKANLLKHSSKEFSVKNGTPFGNYFEKIRVAEFCNHTFDSLCIWWEERIDLADNYVCMTVELECVEDERTVGNFSQDSKLNLTNILIRVRGTFENFDCEVLIVFLVHENI